MCSYRIYYVSIFEDKILTFFYDIILADIQQGFLSLEISPKYAGFLRYFCTIFITLM